MTLQRILRPRLESRPLVFDTAIPLDIGVSAADHYLDLRAARFGTDVTPVHFLSGEHQMEIDGVYASVATAGEVPVSVHYVGPATAARWVLCHACLLYTSDAADDLLCVDLG